MIYEILMLQYKLVKKSKKEIIIKMADFVRIRW